MKRLITHDATKDRKAEPGRRRWRISVILVLAFLLVPGVLTVRKIRGTIARQARSYAYDVTRNYAYDFQGSESIEVDVSVHDGRVRLPSVEEGEYTAFLKVDVSSTFKGQYVQPNIEMTCGELTATQYLERGARGARYLNVSSFMSPHAAEVALTGTRVQCAAQQAKLYYFKNKTSENPTVLVIAPHPDDAEIAAYGFYSDIDNTYIVTITAGEAGGPLYDNVYQDQVAHFLKKGQLRTWNSITVPLLCGIPPERAINLGFFDETLPQMYQNQEANVTGRFTGTSDINTFRQQNRSSLAQRLDGSANWNSLVGNLARLLETIQPDIIVSPYPALDFHPDHKFSSVALFEAIKKCGLKEGRLFLYTNHCTFNDYYPYGPRGGEVSLPPRFQNDIYFSALYAPPLSPEKQLDKLFSLEAMNDIRQKTDRRLSKRVTLMSQIRAPIYEKLGFDGSYYRRAVRRHELFFVVKMNEIYEQEKYDRIMGSALAGRVGSDAANRFY